MNGNIEKIYLQAKQLLSTGSIEPGIKKLTECIEINPITTDATLLLAELYTQKACFKDALHYYKLSKTNDIYRAEAIAGIAQIYRLQGEAEKGFQVITEAFKKHEYNIALILSYSEICLDLQHYKQAIEKIEDVLKNNTDIPTGQKKNLLHTLGKHYDKENEFDQSFKYHQLANNITPHQYQPNQFDSLISRLKKIYSKEHVSRMRKSMVKSQQAVFIVGMPRSGSSLLEQILSSHSEIKGAGELPIIQQLIAETCKGKYPEITQDFQSSVFTDNAQNYLNRACSHKHQYTTDKMPHNYLHIGYIIQMFPECKIINIQRNPIDNCLSIYFQYFRNSHRYATRLENIAHHYHCHEIMMNHWKEVFPEHIINITYEDIINNTQTEITRLLSSLNLEWQTSCLEHHKSQRHVLTASQQQVNKPIYKQSVERWRNYEKHIKPLIKTLKEYQII